MLVQESYRYPHFHLGLMMEDMSFSKGPAPGQPMPEFTLVTQGDELRKSDFIGYKPVLLTFGSIACPMTAAAGPILKRSTVTSEIRWSS